MGAYFILYPKARVLILFPPIFIFHVPAWLMLGYWFVSQFIGGHGYAHWRRKPGRRRRNRVLGSCRRVRGGLALDQIAAGAAAAISVWDVVGTTLLAFGPWRLARIGCSSNSYRSIAGFTELLLLA